MAPVGSAPDGPSTLGSKPPASGNAFYSTGAPQEDLRSANSVLPFLAEMLAVNDPIDCVITEIGVNPLYTSVQIDSAHRPISQ